MYLVVSKSSEFDVKVSAGIIVTTTTDHATLAILGSIGDKLGAINLRSYCSKSEFYDLSKTDVRDLILKEYSFVNMFKEFRYPENTDKALSGQCFSPDYPKVTKGLIVDLS